MSKKIPITHSGIALGKHRSVRMAVSHGDEGSVFIAFQTPILPAHFRGNELVGTTIAKRFGQSLLQGIGLSHEAAVALRDLLNQQLFDD